MGDFVNLSTAVCNKSVAHHFGRSRKASKFAAAVSIANFSNDVISPLNRVGSGGEPVHRGAGRAAGECARHDLIDGNRTSGIKALRPTFTSSKPSFAAFASHQRPPLRRVRRRIRACHAVRSGVECGRGDFGIVPVRILG